MTKFLKTAWPALLYGLIAVAFLPSPFLADFGAEPAALMAAAAFFATIIYTDRGVADRNWPARLGRALLLLLPAAAVLAVGKTIHGPCDPARSLAFFVLFPCVSTVFGFALKSLCIAAGIRRPTVAAIAIGVSLSLIAVIFDVGFHPQFYTYNHVFGGFLGPIYDGYRPITRGLVVFRLLTLLWSAVLILAGLILDRRSTSPRLATVGVLMVIAIAAIYIYAPRIGFVTTHDHIARSLGARTQTEHFDIYYSANSTTSDRIARIARYHEYRFAGLRERFGSSPEGRIASYIYPDTESKGRLTGARTTSVSPVWLRRPQMHVTHESIERTFTHELAHVFSRDYGLPLINASVHVGLVEGLAVAVEPPDGRPSPHELVSSATGGPPSPDRLGAAAFWSGRAAVSYTTMGSFVTYLIDRFGMATFLQAYPSGDLEGTFGLTLEELASGWSEHLRSIRYVCVDAGPYVHRSFAVLSAFERACPFLEPRYARHVESALALVARKDTAAARERAHEAWELAPENGWVSVVAARLALSQGDVASAERYLSGLEDHGPLTSVVKGDVEVLRGRPGEGRRRYAAALEGVPAYLRDYRASLFVRQKIAESPETVIQLYRTPVLPEDSVSVWDRLALARRSFEIGRYELADAILAGGSGRPDGVPAAQAARIEFWSAEIGGEAGRWDEAIAAAERSTEAYAALGDVNGFEEARDLVRYLQWSSRREASGDSSR